MKCPYCSFENAENATHCKVCGNSISSNNTSTLEENNDVDEAVVNESANAEVSNDSSFEEPHQSRIDKELDENPFYNEFQEEDFKEPSKKKGIIIVGGVIALLILAFLMKNLFMSNDKTNETDHTDTNGNTEVPSVILDPDEASKPVSDKTSSKDDNDTNKNNEDENDSDSTSSTWPPANFNKDETGNHTGTNTGSSTSGSSSNSHTSNSNQEVAMPLEGYVSSGSFSGGVDSGTQILSGLRHGLHPNFERLVLDFTTSDTFVTSYAAPIYDAEINGNIITVKMHQVIKFSDTIPKITQNSDIEKMEVIYGSNNENVTLKLTLKSYGRKYKVFHLKDNGRIVIDID